MKHDKAGPPTEMERAQAVQLELPWDERPLHRNFDNEETCPRCGSVLERHGCWFCPICGYASCGFD